MRAGRGKVAGGAATPEGTTPPRDRLSRPGTDRSEAPGPGAMRPLARALLDLALVLTREKKEGKRWTQ